MSKRLELTDKKFGRLTVRWPVGRRKNLGVYWLCQCDCGNICIVVSDKIVSGHTVSCGCFRVQTTGNNLRTHGQTGSPEYGLWKHAKQRANEKGIPFNIEPSDVVIPELCPFLGIELRRGITKLHDNSPTLDRIIPKMGYVKGNVRVISYKANRAKGNLTLDEMKLMVQNWI